jgi:hypothetical protein
MRGEGKSLNSGESGRMRARRLGLVASLTWVVVVALLASRTETWIAAWRLYCRFSGDPTCVGATIYLVIHWQPIALVAFGPVVLGWLIAWGITAMKRGVP